MIYLIGGVSKAGKSFIAKKIMEDKKIPYFSTDFLLWGLGGDDKKSLFSYYDSDDKVSNILEDYILKIISFINENNEDYVIEGTHITYSLYLKVKSLYKDNVSAIFLGYSTISNIDKYNEIIRYEDQISTKWYNHLSHEEFLSFLDEQIHKSLKLKDEVNDLYFDVRDLLKDYNNIVSKLMDN